MERVVASIVAVITVTVLSLPTPARAQKLAGRFGLSLHSGVLKADNLYIDDPSAPDSESRLGIPVGIGLHYFISDNVMGGIDLAFTWLPQWMELWGPTRRWSIVELGAHLKYIDEPSSKISLYGKCGLKMARLIGSIEPGEGLFGGLVGHSVESKTDFAPGWELAVGLMGIPSEGGESLFAEIVFSYLLMEGKDVRANGEVAAWKYPHNLNLYKVRLGVMGIF